MEEALTSDNSRKDRALEQKKNKNLRELRGLCDERDDLRKSIEVPGDVRDERKSVAEEKPEVMSVRVKMVDNEKNSGNPTPASTTQSEAEGFAPIDFDECAKVDPETTLKAAKNSVKKMNGEHGTEKAVCNFGVKSGVEEVTGMPFLPGKFGKANVIYTEIKKDPKWQRISGPEGLHDFADKGYIIVAVWKNRISDKSGHIVMILPGKPFKSPSWGNCEMPRTLDCGKNHRWPRDGKIGYLSDSFGENKKDTINYYIYKGPINKQ